jgi:myo-inositol 2-dehydrogenase/D-chiro-inositol 1-dehydrogenase
MTLRLGVIGTSAIGQDHIRRITNTLSKSKIVAVTDVNVENANAVIKNEKPDSKFYEDGHALINAAEVDSVIVTSWGPTHEEFVLASITACSGRKKGQMYQVGLCLKE